MGAVTAGGLQVAVTDFTQRNSGQGEFGPTHRTFTAFKPVVGPGEVRFALNFPYYFTGRPAFSQGFELELNQGLVRGSFPMYSAGVADWNMSSREVESQQVGVFVGAVMFLVLDGPPNVAGIFHLTFSGMGLAAPVGSIDGMTTSDTV